MWDSVIELLKPVYGLVDGPKAWNTALTNTLVGLGCRQSALDPCVFHYFPKQASWRSEVCGVLAVHDEDLAFAGTAEFFSQVMYPLRQKNPFKHWTVKSGNFLGCKLH